MTLWGSDSKSQTFLKLNFNPNSAGLLNVALVQGGTMTNPKHCKKINFFFDFLKVYNDSGKVKKFWTSRPIAI